MSVASQFTLERSFLNARGKTSYRYKIPDTLVLKFDDTPQTKVVFWVEAKRLPRVAWFSVIGRNTAEGIITETIAQQVNTQAQYTWSYFKLSRNATVYAFVICGPYFTLLRYTGDNLSPDFFGVSHARKGAVVTRLQAAVGAGGNQVGRGMNNQAGIGKEDTNKVADEEEEHNDDDEDTNEEGDYEEDTTQDRKSQPLYPFGTLPQSIFQISEEQFTQGTFELDIQAPLENYVLNPVLLDAFRKILAVHTDIRDVMQNVDWFDCNY